MFRATQCSSSGESIVSIHHLAYITLCRWQSGMQVSDLHTRRPPTPSYIYQMMCWYNLLSWWWALGCSKHVEKWNKHIKKYVNLVINTNCTEMHGQQNITWDTLSNCGFVWYAVVYSGIYEPTDVMETTVTSSIVYHVGGDSRFLCKTGIYLTGYTAFYRRKPYSV
jgi:hypothetical protein